MSKIISIEWLIQNTPYFYPSSTYRVRKRTINCFTLFFETPCRRLSQDALHYMYFTRNISFQHYYCYMILIYLIKFKYLQLLHIMSMLDHHFTITVMIFFKKLKGRKIWVTVGGNNKVKNLVKRRSIELRSHLEIEAAVQKVK